MAIEEPSYTSLKQDGDYEIRDYAPVVVAETRVAGSREQAGNMAFRRLFRYISGNNSGTNKIAMTAPVGQAPAPQKIDMTAPVTQTQAGNDWVVSFMMPAEYTMETLPRPNDSNVALRRIPERRVASVRYSGRWTSTSYEKHLSQLEAWMQKQGLEATGPAEWARYNSPFTLPLLRRNEILIPITKRSRTTNGFPKRN